MIELRYQGIILPLPPGYSTTRQFQSDVITRAGDSYDFTIPMDVPLNDEMLRVLGYPNHIATCDVSRTLQMYLFIDNIYVNQVAVRILKIDSAKRSMSISFYGQWRAYADIVGTKKLADMELGGVRFVGNLLPSYLMGIGYNGDFLIQYAPCDTYLHMTDVANGTVVTDYCFYPAIDTNPNLDTVGIDLDNTRHILNWWNHLTTVPGEVPRFVDPVLEYIAGYLHPDETRRQKDRHFWVPFFRLSYVLKHCFEEFGFTVTSDGLFTADFDKICIQNTYAINETGYQEINSGGFYIHSIQHLGTTINGKNHMPDMTITDFLTAVGTYCNLKYDIDYSAGTVNIRQLANARINTPIIDITRISNPEFVANNQDDLSVSNGYSFSYELDPNNPATGANIDDDLFNEDAKYSALLLFDSWFDLFSITAFPPAMAYVRSLNKFYVPNGNYWAFHADNLGQYNSLWMETLKGADWRPDNLQEIKTKAMPVPMYYSDASEDRISFLTYVGGGGQFWNMDMGPFGTNDGDVQLPMTSCGVGGRNLLAIVLPDGIDIAGGSNTDFRGIFKIVNAPAPSLQVHLCNYIGFGQPFTYNTDTAPIGNVTGWDQHYNKASGIIDLVTYVPNFAASTGTYYQYYRPFTQLLKGSQAFDLELLLDTKLGWLADWNSVFFARDGKIFFAYKGDVNLPFPNTSTITVLRLNW